MFLVSSSCVLCLYIIFFFGFNKISHSSFYWIIKYVNNSIFFFFLKDTNIVLTAFFFLPFFGIRKSSLDPRSIRTFSRHRMIVKEFHVAIEHTSQSSSSISCYVMF